MCHGKTTALFSAPRKRKLRGPSVTASAVAYTPPGAAASSVAASTLELERGWGNGVIRSDSSGHSTRRMAQPFSARFSKWRAVPWIERSAQTTHNTAVERVVSAPNIERQVHKRNFLNAAVYLRCGRRRDCCRPTRPLPHRPRLQPLQTRNLYKYPLLSCWRMRWLGGALGTL